MHDHTKPSIPCTHAEFHNRYAHAQKQAVRVERGHIALDSLSTSQRLAAPGRWDNLRCEVFRAAGTGQRVPQWSP